MQNNKCTFICDQFTEYQDNTLAPEIRAQVDTHLSICTSCQAVFNELKHVLNKLHNLKPIQANPNFTNDLMSKLSTQEQNSVWQKVYQSSYSRVAGYAVAAGLIMALGLNVWIDPIAPGSSRGINNYSKEQSIQNPQTESFAEHADSSNVMRSDSLDLQHSNIDPGASSLQLVSGKK